MKVNLIGLNQKELEKFFLSLGEKSFRSKQVYQWIHQKGVSDFRAMTNISKELPVSYTHLTLPTKRIV